MLKNPSPKECIAAPQTARGWPRSGEAPPLPLLRFDLPAVDPLYRAEQYGDLLRLGKRNEARNGVASTRTHFVAALTQTRAGQLPNF